MVERVDLSGFKRLPVVEVASALGLEVEKGSKCRCFIHEDSNPSLVFFRDSNRWHCFGCGVGGDTIELVKRYLDVDFKEALEWLRRRFLVGERQTPKAAPAGPSQMAGQRSLFSKTERFQADPLVYSWLMDSLGLSAKGRCYLIERRGLDEATIRDFGIKDVERPYGIIAEARDVWGEQRLLRCGLLKKGRDGDSKPVWWSHVILFPFVDTEGRVVSIQGRQVEPGLRGPKYINLYGVKTAIFNQQILGLLQPGDSVYMCEGIMDTLTAHQMGLKAVGIPGAGGFKKEWYPLFEGLQVNVVPDTDGAGQRFAERIEAIFGAHKQTVKIIRLPHGKDLSDYWQSEP
jgi:DNA primase